MFKYFFLIISMLCVGCSKQQNADILETQQFVKIYTQILKEHAKWNPPIADSTRADSIAKAVSEAAGTSIQRLKATISWYRKDSKYWSEFYLEVTKRLEEEERKRTEVGLQ